MAQGFNVVTEDPIDETPVQQDDAFQASAEALVQDLVATAGGAEGEPEAADLWAAAAELREFALGDPDGADHLYGRAVAQDEPPAAAFAGLRRLARQSGETELVGDLYRVESESAKATEQVLRSAAQRALWLLHQNAERGYLASARVLSELDCGDPWALMLAYLVRDDLALKCGQPVESAELKVSRFELAKGLLALDDPAQRSELAMLAGTLATTHLYLIQDGSAATWLERMLDLSPCESALRELVSLRLRRQNVDDLDARLLQFAESATSAGAKARASYELGMLRAHRAEAPDEACDAFRLCLQAGEQGSPAALPFLRLLRAHEGPTDAQDQVDALGLQAELSATGRERADCLYQMALIFDSQLHLPDAAIELLSDSRRLCPGHRPAARALGRLYQRRGAWDLLAELLEEEVRLYPDSRRTRLKLAEVYQDRLGSPERAEPHLRVILDERLYPPALRRYNRLLAGQGRWTELFHHLIACSSRETNTRERLYDLERAAEIAETHLERPDLAVSAWQQVHEIDPLHPGALAALGRLYTRLGEWEQLVALNEDEIAVRDEPEVAARLWTKNGEIYERHLHDDERAQRCFELALEIVPTYEPALESLGRILWRTGDWQGLIEMYQAEIEACGEGPRRIRRLLDLGELQAQQAGLPDDALMTFERVLKEVPHSEEALLWVERLHQILGDDEALLETLEQRLALINPQHQAPLALRAGSLAEWALDEAPRAWAHYVVALGHPVTRGHAVVAMSRLWPRVLDSAETVQAGTDGLFRWISDESDPAVRAMMGALHRRLEQAGSGLDDWPTILAQDSSDLLARAATEVRAASEGQVGELIALRRATRTGGLWSLLAQVDRPEHKLERPAWLPDCAITRDILAEVDLGPGHGARFRELIRAWQAGGDLPELPDEPSSIAALRLYAHHAHTRGRRLEASRFAELEARRWTSPLHRQRRLSDAATARHRLEPASARELFEAALALNCYQSASRRSVYDALEACGELDLLIDGLSDHVANLEEPDARANWLGRLATTLELVGRRDRAAVAWDALLELQPTNVSAQLEHIRLLTLEGELDEARGALERAVRRPFDAEARVRLLGKLADLHLMSDGDGNRAVAVLEEACDLVGREPQWVRRLARAHFTYGSPERSVQLLTEALPSDPTEDDLGDWFLMARAKYLHLSDRDAGRELLWGLFERFPNNVDALRELEGYYRKVGGATELAERLSTILVDPPENLDRRTHAFLWEYVGDLNYQVLRRNRDAEVAYEAAEAVAGERSAGSRLALKVARAVGQQPGKGRDACARFGRALRGSGVGVTEWLEAIEDLEALFESIEDQARVRVMRQIRDLLQGKTEPDSDEARVKRDPARQLEPEGALVRLADGLAGPGSLEAMAAIAPIVERCYGHRRAKRRALGGKRLRSTDAPTLLNVIDLTAETLQSGVPKVYAGSAHDQPEWLLGGGHWLPQSIIDESSMLTIRFWGGHVAGTNAFAQAAVALAEPGELGALLRELHRLERGGAPDTEDPIHKIIAASRYSGAREQIAALIEEHPDLVERAEREVWCAVPLAIADRVGLLLSGDVRASIDGVLTLEDDHRYGQRSQRIVGEARTRRLLEFALSYAYQELRYLAGLAGKPKLL